MNTSKKIVLGTAIVFVSIALAIDPYFLGLCISDKTFCLFDGISHGLGKPLVYISIAFLLSSTLALLSKEKAFSSWVKVSFFLLPLIFLLVFVTPEYGGGGIITIDRGFVSFALSILYFGISFILIAYKSWRLRVA